MKITKRDLQISMALIGVLAAAFSYFFVFTKLQEKTEVITAENVILEGQAAFLETIAMKRTEYLANTKTMQEETNAIIAGYDNGYAREDSIMYLYNLQKAGISDAEVNNITMAMPEAVVSETAQPVDPTQPVDPAQPAADGTAAPAAGALNPDGTPVDTQVSVTDQYTPKIVDNGISLYKVPTTIGFLVSYSGFKNVMDYIYSTGGHKSMDNVTIAFDNTTGKLTCNATMNTYFMTGTSSVYESEFIPSMSTGTDNLFKTVEAGNIDPNVVQEADTENEQAE